MRFFILTVMVLSFYLASAQKLLVHGIVKDSAKHLPVSYATIKNLSADQTIFTDDKGQFTLSMEEKGLLYITAVGYVADTLHFNDFGADEPLTINLKPFVKELQGVTVSAKAYDQYQYDSMSRRKQFIADGGLPTSKTTGLPISGNYGYALNIDKFIGPEKKKRRSYDFFEENEEQAYVDFHFTPAFVHKYSGLTGDLLQKFMQTYRPDHVWLRKHHSDEDLKYYINDKLKLFFNRGDETENK
jgi:hypothetical protein